MDTQITNTIVCDTSKCMLYERILPHLVGEHAFPLRVLFAGWLVLHLVAAMG